MCAETRVTPESPGQEFRSGHQGCPLSRGGMESSRMPLRGLHPLLERGTFAYSEVPWACQALRSPK